MIKRYFQTLMVALGLGAACLMILVSGLFSSQTHAVFTPGNNDRPVTDSSKPAVSPSPDTSPSTSPSQFVSAEPISHGISEGATSDTSILKRSNQKGSDFDWTPWLIGTGLLVVFLLGGLLVSKKVR